MMVVPLSMGLISIFAGALSDRFGPRGISLAGLLLLVVGCLSIAGLSVETTAWGYIFHLLPLGLGLGLFLAPNNSAVMGGAPKEHLGVASGLLALSRTMGHTTGIPLAGVLFTTGMMASGRVRIGRRSFPGPAAGPGQRTGRNLSYHRLDDRHRHRLGRPGLLAGPPPADLKIFHH